MHDQRQDSRQEMMAAMAARLARVRGNLTDLEFGQLLADMVTTIERFAEIDARPRALRSSMSPEEIRRLLDIKPG